VLQQMVSTLNILCNTQYQHMNVSWYLGTCSLLDPCWWELFCLSGGGEYPGKVCNIGFETSCIFDIADHDSVIILSWKVMTHCLIHSISWCRSQECVDAEFDSITYIDNCAWASVSWTFLVLILRLTVCCHMEVCMFISSITVLPKVVINFLKLVFIMILISAGWATWCHLRGINKMPS
jgi:hypothetical protein